MKTDAEKRPDRFSGSAEFVVVKGKNKSKVLGADPAAKPTPGQQALLQGKVKELVSS